MSGAISAGDFRGDLQRIGTRDLLQRLAMNRRSGTLSVSTVAGAGEVRVSQGEVVDAVYRGLEGEKALYRLLGESEGSFSFIGGSPQFLQRIRTPTSVLLRDGQRHEDECRKLREALALETSALLAVAPAEPSASEAEARVLEALTTPRTLSELLDEMTLPDLAILEVLPRLLSTGRLRRIATSAVRVELADPERLAVWAALVKRALRSGYGGPPRVVVAASRPRLLAIRHALGQVAEVTVPARAVPAASVPYVLATLRLGEAEVEVMGLPLVEAYAPLWGLALPGAAALARLEAAAGAALDTACANAGVALLEAAALLPARDEGDAEKVAQLLRALLERALGG